MRGLELRTHSSEKVAASRFAASEDPRTRLMRVEVDIKNPNEKIRRGMYGRVTLQLEPGSPSAERLRLLASLAADHTPRGAVVD